MRENITHTKIIIACPEAPLRRVLVHSLHTLGCGGERVASHRALLARCVRHRYALVLTCFCAPLIEDFRVTSRLRGASLHTSLFVLADNPSPSEVVALLERGVEQVLTLPVSILRLRAKIEGSLSQKFRL